MKRAVAAGLCLCLLIGCAGSVAAEKLPVSAASAVVFEPQGRRILYEKDAYAIRPMASTTKLMTALLADERLDPDEVLTVTPEAVLVEGTALGLRGGDRITVCDLVTGLLLESGNDAANVLACRMAGSAEAFAGLMNRRAMTLGMTRSCFETPSGLDRGHHSTCAFDMALLAAEVLRHDRLAAICRTKKTKIAFGNPPCVRYVSNHNRLLSLYPYTIGMKTGFTKKAGRCLVSAAQKDNRTLIVVTLNAPDDWKDHMALYEDAFPRILSCQLAAPLVGALPVSGGTEDCVALSVETPGAVTLLKEEAGDIQTVLRLPRFLWAPVKSGQTVGGVCYLLNGKIVARTEIRTKGTVPVRPALSFFTRFSRLLGAMWREILK